jgi:hypothetical protein
MRGTRSLGRIPRCRLGQVVLRRANGPSHIAGHSYHRCRAHACPPQARTFGANVGGPRIWPGAAPGHRRAMASGHEMSLTTSRPAFGGCCAPRASAANAGAGPSLASETVCKPSSVPRCDPRGRSSIYDGGCPPPLAADPRAERTRPCRAFARRLSYLALLQVEFARFTPAQSVARPAGSSLWHWSSPLGGRELPATLRSRSSDFPRAIGGFPR